MKSSAFAYRRPVDVAHALSLLSEYPDDAKVLAGGQSLLPLMGMRFARTLLLIDVSRLDELSYVSENDDSVSYGAGVVHSAFEDARVPDRTGGLIRTAASGIGYRAIRNRGTIGGSLAHADASAEWPCLMAALDARIIARSVRGERTLSAREFVLGFFWNALDDDELIVRVEVPRSSAAWGWHKSVRKSGEFAESLACVLIEPETPRATTWLGAARDVPLALEEVNRYLVDLLSDREPLKPKLDDTAKRQVLALVARDLGPAETPASRFEHQLHGIAVWRALNDAAGKQVSWN